LCGSEKFIIINSTFANCSTCGSVGCVYVINFEMIEISEGIFSNNSAKNGSGGALYFSDGTNFKIKGLLFLCMYNFYFLLILNYFL
jgi:predicted outer membrane repeat protein